ncbi:hypothetical protein [Streptococcus parauberis]|uniref:hypothetical protein n=1 Tax=Streptococcus parauberis TaxID=1348 RepID=UPI0002BB5EE9|nr:hypothetical protein [Streptococcus parauberis]EMF49662.1 hypothetical protein SPJ2_0482 [Streptococcus parauberis KRS-02109]UWM87791.1 hypothetical protein N2A93_04470 [Streptococcus parauberis]UWM89763.1 hypothetical protein N2A96_04465 [Streptococcus parauberis]
MFRITNIHTRVQENFNNRDDVLSAINEKSVWSADRGEEIILLLEQLSDEGTVLDTSSVTLPLQEIVEEALSNFGLKKEKKKFSLIQKKKLGNSPEEQEPLLKKKQSLTMPVSAPEKVSLQEKNSSLKNQDLTNKKVFYLPKLLMFCLTLLSLIFSILSFSLVLNQAHKIETTNYSSVKTIQSFNKIESGESDVFCRYFLPNYFSGNDSHLKDFISSNNISVQEATLQSVLLEKVSQRENKRQALTYVIALKEKDEVRTKRLTIIVKKAPTSRYGFEVVKQPKETQYP